MHLKDKVAVVTGAASGIGKEIARTFADAGAKVAIADLNAAAANAAADELNSPAQRAIAVAMDVTRESDVDSGMAAVVSAFGRIDVLVSNAGIQIVAPWTSSHSPNGNDCWQSTWTAPSSPPARRSDRCTSSAAGPSSTWGQSIRR